MRLHKDDAEGPPCGFMHNHLQSVADGTANPLVRLYVAAHTSGCARCDRFHRRLKETLVHLRAARADAVAPSEDADALARLAAGPWTGEPHSGPPRA